MKPFKIKHNLKLEGCKISGRILNVKWNESYRGDNRKVYSKKDFYLQSCREPYLGSSVLYILGRLNEFDEDLLECIYQTEERAKEVFSVIMEATYEHVTDEKTSEEFINRKDMKKYKLLKNIPSHDAGTIFHLSKNNQYYIRQCPSSNVLFSQEEVENDPEWFEEIIEEEEKFKKDLCLYNNVIVETFETQAQAEVMKELREHIHSFDKPSITDKFYIFDDYCKWSITEGDQSNKLVGLVLNMFYYSGLIMNINTTKEDREKRIELIKKAYNI